MKKHCFTRIVFIFSVIANMGAAFVYIQWIKRTLSVWERVKEVQNDLDLFKNAGSEGYRVCYADNACSLAARADGTYLFSAAHFGDKIALAVMLENLTNGTERLSTRRYILAGRNFVTSWKYDDNGRCCDVIYQYNDGPQMRDASGNGTFKRYQADENLNYSERAYERAYKEVLGCDRR